MNFLLEINRLLVTILTEKESHFSPVRSDSISSRSYLPGQKKEQSLSVNLSVSNSGPCITEGDKKKKMEKKQTEYSV